MERVVKDLNTGRISHSEAVEKVAELGVTKVISGDFGPKAKTLLERLKIQMVMFSEKDKSVQDIIDKVKN